MKDRRYLLALIPMSLGGLLLFALELRLAGYVAIAFSLLAASQLSRQLLRDLSLIALGLIAMSAVPINTDISYQHMALMGAAMTVAVVVPYLVSRHLYRDHTITFPFGLREPWGKGKWLYLLMVFVLGYTILPIYMITTGVYLNWPAISDADSISRLFIGTNALGIWDELFFICVAFVVFRKYAPFWAANLLAGRPLY